MKRIIALTLAFAGMITAVSGCSFGRRNIGGKLNVVTTIYPEYDWVREIAGDEAEITLLLDNGVDMHSYEPSVDDIMMIKACDVFIYVGGESDAWVSDALKEAANEDTKVINLIEVLGDSAKTEESLPGIGDEEKGGEAQYDEHVWLSVKNAEIFCKVIGNTLAEADPENAELYKQNANNYQARLSALDREYSEALDNAKYDTLLFGDRFPFRYLTEDYGLKYYAAFDGCSAETEASVETVTFLTRKLDSLNLPAVLTIDNSDEKLADTIIENSRNKNHKIISMNSMQSISLSDAKDLSYITIMQDNLEALKAALN